MSAVKIDHYSDVLCVWAYISQVRVQELRDTFEDDVDFSYHYIDIFGDIRGKMQEQWSSRGGVAAYATHVHEIVDKFEHVSLHKDVWRKHVPVSSMPAHVFLSAAAHLEAEDPILSGAQDRLDSLIRAAFFELNLDVSDNDTLLQLVDEAMLPVDRVLRIMRRGIAHAKLSSGLKSARESGVKSSPTMTFNEGRQMLSGNVGYRILEANVRELLEAPGDQQSWC